MPTTYTPPTPEQVRALRGGLTQQQFANKIGVSKSAIEKFEDGRQPMRLHTWEWAKAILNHPDALMTLKHAGK